MTNTDSTSNEQNKENSTTHIDTNASTLHSVISNAHLLHQTGYDTTKHAPVYVGDTEQLSYLEGAADASITTIGLGIAVIGKLMVSQDKILGCIGERDISALGWLLNDLGASIVALQNIQTQAGDAVSLARKIN